MKVLRSARVIAVVVTAAGIGLAACGGGGRGEARAVVAERRAAVTTTVRPVERPTEPIDRLVAVGESGARMHLTCTGSGAETVVLVSGFGDDGSSWGAVAPELAKQFRVCMPVRFGLGTSDAPPEVQSFETEAASLHDVLDAAGEPGPYVVVGHSFGGAEAVTFTARHPDEVAGLVLIDASPVDWPSVACAVPDNGSAVAASFRTACASFSDPAQNPERLAAPGAFAAVDRITSLGSVPMAVLSRADVAYPDLGRQAEQVVAAAWHDGQEQWAALSTESELVLVEQTGHVIQLDQPAIVIDQVLALRR